MAAGAAVFAAKGYDAATMTEIAAQAGASIGSLYQFFPTKALLANALHAEQLDALSSAIERLQIDAPGQTAAVLADRILQQAVEFLAEHPEFVALVDRRDVEKSRKREIRTRLLAGITGLLSHASPPIPSDRARILAIIILQLMKAAIFISLTDDDATSDAVVAELRQMLTAHLRA